MKFKELNLSEKTLKGITDMGFVDMMPIQEKAIPEILNGKDVVGQARTGTGKTAAFGIPMFENIDYGYINHLIMAPTRELAIQIVDELRKIGKYHKTNVATIVGGMDMRRQISTLKTNPAIVVATPGRLNDMLKRKKIDLSKIKFFVIDEVDEMYKAGFKEELDEIIKYLPEVKQSLLFSATISKNVEKIAKETMDNRVDVYVSSGTLSVDNIKQECIIVKEKHKFTTLTKLLDIDKPNLAIVFGRTRRRADELGEALNKAGYRALSLHGDLSQSQRNKVMRSFRENEGHILVATDVAARGIDVAGVTHVYNFDLPQETEFYTHRIGRTGRAGAKGKATSFAREGEMNHIERIRKETKSIIKIVPAPNMENIREANKSHVEKKIEDYFARIDVSKNKDFAEELINKYGADKLVMAMIEMNMRKTNITDIQLTGEPPVKGRGYSKKSNRSGRSRSSRGGSSSRSRSYSKGSSSSKDRSSSSTHSKSNNQRNRDYHSKRHDSTKKPQE